MRCDGLVRGNSHGGEHAPPHTQWRGWVHAVSLGLGRVGRDAGVVGWCLGGLLVDQEVLVSTLGRGSTSALGGYGRASARCCHTGQTVLSPDS